MKKVIFLALACLVALTSCDNNRNSYSNGQVSVNSQPQIVVTPVATNLGDNLNLQALGELVKSSNNAEDIENKLNQTGSINNLDLDGDGSVDYIKVTEYGDGTAKGFSFTVEMAGGEKQEIATISIEKGASNVAMNIQGNQQIYGGNAYYQSHYSLGDLMIMNYLFSYHRPYYSPYHYGYYPSYYHSYRPIGVGAYGSRVASTTRTSTITRTTTSTSKIKSPNSNLASKSVSTRAQSLANPTRSQKSFTKTSSSNSRPSTGGFGSNKSGSSGSSSPSKSSWFGSSKSSGSSSSSSSSFGSSSRSSGSSSRSSSRRSDVRFKTNITPLTNSLDKVCSLQGMSYDWKADEFPTERFDNKKQIGFIAQDLEKVYPAVVNTRRDGFKIVDYDLLVPALVESIKELRTQNVKQDSLIQVLLGTSVTAKK